MSVPFFCSSYLPIVSPTLYPNFPHRLAKDLIQVTQLKPEPWIAMGHFCNATSRKPRAVYFAQKVSKMWIVTSSLGYKRGGGRGHDPVIRTNLNKIYASCKLLTIRLFHKFHESHFSFNSLHVSLTSFCPHHAWRINPIVTLPVVLWLLQFNSSKNIYHCLP